MTTETQPNAVLYEHLKGWFETIDEALTEADVPLPERPFRALLELLSGEVLEVGFGNEKVNLSRPSDHVDEAWFRVLYLAAERWYESAYGVEAVRRRGVAPLEGVVFIRGSPFLIEIPAHRTKVHKEGEESWMYFEEGLANGEDALKWVRDGPDLAALDSDRRTLAIELATRVATALRFIQFRRIGIKDRSAAGLWETCMDNLRRAARRIVSAKAGELPPGWFDLQMAMEAALKLVLLLHEGGYPHTHKIVDLLRKATAHGVVFDAAGLSAWPAFDVVSDYRYGQGAGFERRELFEAYLHALDVVVAAMAIIPVPFKSGFGFLLRRPPWLSDAKQVEF